MNSVMGPVVGLGLRALPYAGFLVVVLAAIGFASFAVWRGNPRGRFLLAGAIALFLLGVGGGTYGMLGQPGLALRESKGLETRDVRGLVPYLIARVRKDPNDEQTWIYLGRAYISAGDTSNAAKAYGRAVTLMRLSHKPDPSLLSLYGEMLVAVANGAISPDAEQAFNESLSLNPRDAASRYFLGQARAAHGDRQGAIALWQNLLADVPATSPLHQELIDRIALLTAQTHGGAGAPDPTQMVAMLAADLKASPRDAAGWQRLIRAYSVLGERDKAKAALATARSTFADDKDELKRLDSEAADLKLR